MPLARVEAAGVAGVPDLAIELGALTALIGTRGSGKSQLLVAIAWLLTGRPAPGLRAGSEGLKVTGVLGGDGRRRRIERRLEGPGERSVGGSSGGPAPQSTFLRAADRLSTRIEAESGWVGDTMSVLLAGRTTDASLDPRRRRRRLRRRGT